MPLSRNDSTPMGNILLLDESPLAADALRGILSRGGHRCASAQTTEEAWRLLREGVAIDLVVLDLNLKQNAGAAFLQRLHEEGFWKNLPVVIYTTLADPAHVRSALALKIQNYLIKPYQEKIIYAEIAKAAKNPWRDLHFEEPHSFCAQMGIVPEHLTKFRLDLMTALDAHAKIFAKYATERSINDVFTRIDGLIGDAENAGVWAAADALRTLRAYAENRDWASFANCEEPLGFVSRLIFSQINPTYIPDILRSEEERILERENAERARWFTADVDTGGPVVAARDIENQVSALPSCPVIDTAAAGFLMSADGRTENISQVMELVAEDPGLSAQVLIAANRQSHAEMTSIDDPRAAVSLLGEMKLHALGKSLLTIPERHMHVPPTTWAKYWMFQVGVGKLAQFICDYLEFSYLVGNAYTAGLLHDIGKLVLLRLHPFGFQAMVRHAQEKKIPLHAAEQKFIGCTTRDIGARFAQTTGLPPIYADVIRWVETPELATDHIDLVAMVSLARHVCLHNHVGYCGDTPDDACPPISDTPAWRVLQPRLFPSFDLAKFEVQAHARCLEVRSDLLE